MTITREQVVQWSRECELTAAFHPQLDKFIALARADLEAELEEAQSLSELGHSLFAKQLVENDRLKVELESLRKDAVPEGYTLVPTEILDRFPEINPSNYDHDDACALNAWGVELVLAAAPKQEK